MLTLRNCICEKQFASTAFGALTAFFSLSPCGEILPGNRQHSQRNS
jgi:hypothetical protein